MLNKKKANEVIEETDDLLSDDAVNSTAKDKIEDDIEVVPIEELLANTGAFDDFTWDAANKRDIKYTKEERERFTEKYDQTLSSLLENEIVAATVTSITSGDVVLDLNFKFDGLLSVDDFKDIPDLKVGDKVDVYVERQEDEKGQFVLSRQKAKLLKAWESLKDSFENGTVIKGTVTSKTKGGLIVDCNGLQAFLPGSQIDIKPTLDYDQFVGKEMEFKVVNINETIKNAVVSHKAVVEGNLAEQSGAIVAHSKSVPTEKPLANKLTKFKIPEKISRLTPEGILANERNARYKGVSFAMACAQGISITKFFELAALSRLPKEWLATEVLSLSYKTLQRYAKENKDFSPRESESVLKMIALYEKGIEIFGDYIEFNHWLKEPAFGLGEQVPFELLKTSTGIDLIMEELARIEFGATA